MRHFELPFSCRPTLGVGADIVSAPSLAIGRSCHIAEPVNDLSILENYKKFRLAVKELLSKTKPELIACDLHPGYFSTQYAHELHKELDVPLIRVQHHRAHAAACAADNNIERYAAIICDGLGYGDDGHLWGGEVFNGLERIGSLEEQPQTGGDSATIYPRRMLFGILSKFLNKRDLERFIGPDVKVYMRQLEQGFNVFTTTSTGRVLDSAAALLDICDKRTFEGEPAIKLMQAASGKPYYIEPVIHSKDREILDTTALFRFLVDNIHMERARLAMTVHLYIANGLYRIAKKVGKPIVFSGGVAHNSIISVHLQKQGVLLHKELSPGDACVSVGQVLLAQGRA